MDPQPVAVVVVIWILQLSVNGATATHFRGVHMWWDSLDGKRFVNLYYRVAWKRDWRDETYCDMMTIDEGRWIGPPTAGYLKCVGCQPYTDAVVGDLLFRCTDYSALENWSAGVGNHSYHFPSDGKFIVKWQGRGWLDGVHEGHDAPWSVIMSVDLRPRRDTSRSNNSPRSAVPPIIRLQYGCSHVISLPVTDPDGDTVLCRWATNTGVYDECGGICGAFQGAHLYQENCTLVYTANKEQGYFAVAIQIEDYVPDSAPYISNVNSLSSVPLQFLVLVYQARTNIPCDSKPLLIDPTPKADTCITLKPGDVYKVKLVARVRDGVAGLRDIQTVSLLGMNKSEVGYYNKSRLEYYVDVTWKPSEAQIGQHVFCFAAIDGYSISSDQRCIFLVVTKDDAPKVAAFDYNVISRQVTIAFDQQIEKPPQSRYIYVHSKSSDAALLILDTSRSDAVNINDTDLSFTLPENITKEKVELYVLLDPGAVQRSSTARCGKDSVELKNPNVLILDTVGISPIPTLTTEILASVSRVTDGPLRPTPSSGSSRKDYTWLIVVIVVLIVLFAIAVLVAILVYRKNYKNKYSRKERQEQYTRSIASKVASNGAYEPDFNDIDVKFR